MIRPYAQISATERARTLDHEDALLTAAGQAHAEGWHAHERDVIAAEARRLGLIVWPALIDRLTRGARCNPYAHTY